MNHERTFKNTRTVGAGSNASGAGIMRIPALIVFGILAALLFFPTIAWTVAALDWVVSGDNGKDVWRPGFVGLAFLGYVSAFTWWNIKQDKSWPNKTKRVIVEYVDKDGNPVEVK